MASRNTLKEAKELKAQFEQDYPGIKIVISDKSSERRVGRRVAESKGFEIIEDSGVIMVTVKEMRFEIMEMRGCECGDEYATAAIGEVDSGKCQKCSETQAVAMRAKADQQNIEFAARLELDRLYGDR